MPIFEYRCEQCRGSFEQLVLSADAAAPQCTHCGSGSVRKLFSAFATSLAGPGTASASASEGPGCGRCGSMNPCGSA